MIIVKRSPENPILAPFKDNFWEAEAAYNGCPIETGENFHMVYRALSLPLSFSGQNIRLSTIGVATSSDGLDFHERKQLITPEYEWERFGCEDPRVTKVGDKYYIFYTALSMYPFEANGIKVGVAITKDFETIIEKHPVTPFNAKGMALFPEKINGKLTAVLSVNTDKQPWAQIGIAQFEKEEEIWSEEYWNKWYASLNDHIIPLQRGENEQVEVGSPPIKTEDGWLLIYANIKNYFSENKEFGVEAVLLKKDEPKTILARTAQSLMSPEEYYERFGQVKNIVFPSGAILVEDNLWIYYGASDTTTCVATVKLSNLFENMETSANVSFLIKDLQVQLSRYGGNPIIEPTGNAWENWATFNAAAVMDDEKIHILYRAMGNEKTSSVGYAISRDGFHIDERSDGAIYIPREDFELKKTPGNSGCEDPRVTIIGDDLFMCYTAYDGVNATRIALTSISLENFRKKNWVWTKPILISSPNEDDKDACLFPERFMGFYIFLHRFTPCIWIDRVAELDFEKGPKKWVAGRILLEPRPNQWDSAKIGIASPPLKTKDGWLLLYHGLSSKDEKYRLGAALLDYEKPEKVIARLDHPILEPEAEYEMNGIRPQAVFSCGAVVKSDELLVYYGAADQVTAVAGVGLSRLLTELKNSLL